MREAIGGAWLYYLVLVFLIIYVFFMSFIMNYASTSRAANYVITQIENCQAQNEDCNGNDISKIQEAIWNKYRYPRDQAITICCMNNGKGSTIRVKLPVEFDVPFFGTIDWISVKAESKTLQVNCSNQNIGRMCS